MNESIDLKKNCFRQLCINITNDINIQRYSLVSQVPDWSKYVLIVYSAVVFVFGVPGNSIVIAVQRRNRTKSSTDWFVTFVAIGDLISVIISCPIYVMLATDLWQKYSTTLLCNVHFYVAHATFTASIFFMLLIGFDRYSKTFCCGQYLTPKRAKVSGCVVFVGASLCNLVYFFTSKNNPLNQCIYDPKHYKLQASLYGISILLLTFTCCALVLIYGRIVWVTRITTKVWPVKHIVVSLPRTTQSTSTSLTVNDARPLSYRITHIMMAVTTMFIFFSIIPALSAFVVIIADVRRSNAGKVLIFFLIKMQMVNTITNPLFYIFMNASFRRRAIRLVREFYCAADK